MYIVQGLSPHPLSKTMTQEKAYQVLWKNYFNKVKYCAQNIYCFHHKYKETDFLVVQNNGYCIDIELKLSRQDFLRDKNKIHKHSILKNGFFTLNYKYFEGFTEHKAGEPICTNNRPNKFFYCCPEGMIKEDELEPHEGLLYITELGKIKKIKEPKFLHKEKLDLEPVLCRKFYYSYLKIKGLQF